MSVDMEEKEEKQEWTFGALISIPILIFFALLMHQSFIGFIMDGAIGYMAAKLYIDKKSSSEGNILVAMLIFVVVLFLSAYIIGLIARNVLGGLA